MKKNHSLALLCFMFFLKTFPSIGQTKLESSFNKSIFIPGDTLTFEINLSDSFKSLKTATLHLWIEEISTGKKWHYKYPLVNGYLNAKMIIDSTISPGNYAYNFLLQRNFFRIKGKVKNALKKDKQITYVLLTKNRDIVQETLALDNNKFFMSECLLFQDSANIIFSRPNHHGAIPEITFLNETDSSYVMADSLTNFISIINKEDSITKKIIPPINYYFSYTDKYMKNTMAAVIVNSKTKKIIDAFQKDNVSGMFGGADGTIIDGLGSDEIARSGNLFSLLMSRIAGLTTKTTDEGIDELMWRKHHTDFYIDEVKVDPQMALDIPLFDIAMIKIFEPGTQVSFGSGAGGTVAIYLKNGIYKNDNRRTNNFKIMGYTGLSTIWK